MFYGSYFHQLSNNSGSKIHTLENLMNCNNCINHKIKYINFDGGIFIHKNLPYVVDDFVHIDINNGLLVMLSGAIFNQTSLREQVNLYERINDPALISRLFLKYGPIFIQKLIGEFAIFIYQSFNNKIFLFRDHMGVHPVSYIVESNSLIFSTDFISLSRCFGSTESIDQNYLISLYKNINLKTTPYKKVVKLLPGTYIEFSNFKIKTTRYWQPELIKIDSSLNRHNYLNEIRNLIEDSVKIRCDSRLNTGTHVSGGLDSGIVTVFTKMNYPKHDKFYGFSWSPENYHDNTVLFDERKMVIDICKKYGIIPIFSSLTEENIINYLNRYIENFGFYHEENILEQASNLKVNLLMSGFGGDEFVSKGDSGIMSDLLFGFHWGTYVRKNPINNPKKFMKTLLYNVIFPAIGQLSPC